MIKNNLSKLMGQYRYTILEVAKSTGMSTTTISNLYHEKAKRLDFETLDKLCKLFKCKVSDILEYIPDRSVRKRS